MLNTRHNLSASGPGPVVALTETRVCVFCHTPHNATPMSPLWNKEIEPQVYSVYSSPTLKSGPLDQPRGPTKLCLTCHDGTIAMGTVVNPVGGISMAGGGSLPSGSLSNFGLDLSGHHPVSFSYSAALPNAELVSTPPPELTYGGVDEVHCSTCHDPHKDTYGKFLVKDNRFSALCVTCHQINGWSNSDHATETESVTGILPRPGKTFPAWTQLNEWGCETCHTPHFAPTGEQLLNFTALPPDPFSCTSACHSSQPPPPHLVSTPGGGASLVAGAPTRPGTADIAGQIAKVSSHNGRSGMVLAASRGASGRTRSGNRNVGCIDCHNPHLSNHRKTKAPQASGLLAGVWGIDRHGVEIRAVSYEYEVCFKCHSDATPDLDYVPRVLGSTNTRLAFEPSNSSYHPVVSMGKNLNVPSIPSSFSPGMNPSELIYCTSCHADDEGGSRGPHGSSFPPILKQRYETADYTPETYENYALCYQCHDRTSILNDVSFGKKRSSLTSSGGGHSGHLAAGASCAACHDPHGVSGMGGGTTTGSHTHLINFDTRTVLPRPGAQYPVFNDTGTFSGGCNLVCHGVDHDSNASYP